METVTCMLTSINDLKERYAKCGFQDSWRSSNDFNCDILRYYASCIVSEFA